MTNLKKISDYNGWANHAWIQFISDNNLQDSTVLKLLSHIIHGQRIWLQRINGEEPNLDVWNPLVISQIIEIHDLHQQLFIDLCNENSDSMITYTRVTGESYQSSIEDILVHIFLHGMHHRGQMATKVSHLGLKPPNTDFIQFNILNKL